MVTIDSILEYQISLFHWGARHFNLVKKSRQRHTRHIQAFKLSVGSGALKFFTYYTFKTMPTAIFKSIPDFGFFGFCARHTARKIHQKRLSYARLYFFGPTASPGLAIQILRSGNKS